MKTKLLLSLLLLVGCNESKHKSSSDSHGQFADICAMEDGDVGFTTSWAFTGSYPVFDSTGGTIDTQVARKGDRIIFKGESKSRAEWGCDRPLKLDAPKPERSGEGAGTEV